MSSTKQQHIPTTIATRFWLVNTVIDLNIQHSIKLKSTMQVQMNALFIGLDVILADSSMAQKKCHVETVHISIEKVR